MCGIFGIGFLKETKLKDKTQATHLIESLGKETESYGRVCSGITLANPFRITFAKNHEGMSSFLKNQGIKNMLRDKLVLNSLGDDNTYALIGHGRFPTKGAKENNNNNHPIRVGNIVGVHAGMLSSDDSLFESNINNFQRIGEVDSEIIFQLLNFYRGNSETGSMVMAIQRTAPLLKGSFSCAVLSAVDRYKLYLFRSGPTLDVMFYSKIGLVVFATSYKNIIEPVMKDIFKKEELEGRSISLDLDTGLAINLLKNTYSTFSLTKEVETLFN